MDRKVCDLCRIKNGDGVSPMKKIANVLLGLIAWISYYFGKRKKKKTIGNFHRKYKYTKKQWNFYKKSFAFERSADTDRVLPLVYGVLDYYKYLGRKFIAPATNVALHLLNDIYKPTVLTESARKSLLNDETSRKTINRYFNDLLCKYGHLDIVYRERDYEVLKGAEPDVIPSSDEGNHFYLTSERVGITVAKFLAYYKGGIKVPADVLEKWSGIPRDRFEDAYLAILQIFKDELEQDNRWVLLFGPYMFAALQAFMQY